MCVCSCVSYAPLLLCIGLPSLTVCTWATIRTAQKLLRITHLGKVKTTGTWIKLQKRTSQVHEA